MTLEEAKEIVEECKRRRTVPLADFLTRKFEPKHGTDARWDECDCEDCHRARPYPRNCTLSPEEIRDANEDGVDVDAITHGWPEWSGGDDVSWARREGAWFWTTSKTAFASGLYDEAHDVHAASPEMCAALDRVVDHWARVAEMDKIAAAVAASLKDARAWAEKHIAAFAKSIDALSIEAAEPRRGMVIALRMYLQDFDRLIRFYEAQADGSKP